ncbi:MAG: TonB-dependent receptor [Phocaeicola sp.]|uniref:TonB-dependent receptor n=1 Tax=Phocaeicola sp. TaxID=2773926 RepID=UPI003F9F46C4
MKITLFFCFLFVFQLNAENIYSQNAPVDLKTKTLTVSRLISEIEKQTDYLFIYSKSDIDTKQVVKVSSDSKTVNEVLSSALSNSNIGYSFSNNYISLYIKDRNEIAKTEASQQQSFRISGKVVDSNGDPIIGANVLEKGTTRGTITDVDGAFVLDVSKDATLEITYIGYLSQTIKVTDKTSYSIVLQEDSKSLEEVVVVGYGVQKKENLAGAVSAIKGDEIASSASFDVTNAISGRLPGTFVTQGSGEPGNDQAKILIRGRSTLGDKKDIDPLIVVDGIPGRSLYEIDPNDIKNISVLKDASAAIYGSQAANGVILVTTKSGESEKPVLNYQYQVGFNTPTILPKMLDAAGYAKYVSDYQDYMGLSRLYSDRDIELFGSGVDPWEHPNTNWLDVMTRKWTTEERHNVSISGGTKDKVRYYASFGYKKNDAIYEEKSANYKQYNYRLKIDVPIIDWIETSVSYTGYVTKKKYPTASIAQLFGWGTMVVPTQNAYWPTGDPGPDFEGGVNPAVNASFIAGYNQTDTYKHEANVKVSIKPPMIKGLSLDGFFNFDVDSERGKLFKKPWTLYFANKDKAVRDANGFITSMELTPMKRGLDSPELTESYTKKRRTMFNLSASYGRTFGDHTFNLFASFEQYDESYDFFDAYRKYFISDLVQALDAGGEKDKTNSGKVSIYARKSWIARLNYNFKNRYLLEFIYRRDGSLKFPPSGRWGNFPALLLAWRASEEPFWKEHISFIDYFKLRGTIGKMGMDPGDAFQYINKYALGSGMTLGQSKDVVTKIYQSVVANPNITWEKQTSYNIGFDSRFWKNMLYMNFEFFYNKRSDILITRNASVPGFSGLALPDENVGKVDNKGIELEAGYTKKWGDFSVDFSGNISWARNKVKYMDEPERAVAWQVQTGHPYGAQLVYKAIGIFKDQAAVDAYPHWDGARPGDVIFEDVSGDGKINADDRILLDKSDAPEIFYGVKLDLQYKNWRLSLLGQGQGTYYRSTISGNRGIGQNIPLWYGKGYWTPENANSTIARPFHRADQYWSYQTNNSTYWYDNMAYFRLKNVTLSYSIPQRILNKFYCKNASVFFTGNNLCLLYSSQKNYDPETANPQGYPTMRSLSVGVNVTF